MPYAHHTRRHYLEMVWIRTGWVPRIGYFRQGFSESESKKRKLKIRDHLLLKIAFTRCLVISWKSRMRTNDKVLHRMDSESRLSKWLRRYITGTKGIRGKEFSRRKEKWWGSSSGISGLVEVCSVCHQIQAEMREFFWGFGCGWLLVFLQW